MPKKRKTNPNYNKLKKLWNKYNILKGESDIKGATKTAEKIIKLQKKMKIGYVADFPELRIKK